MGYFQENYFQRAVLSEGSSVRGEYNRKGIQPEFRGECCLSAILSEGNTARGEGEKGILSEGNAVRGNLV